MMDHDDEAAALHHQWELEQQQLNALIARALGDALNTMNSHINAHGEIERSSAIIKGWHNYNNLEWGLILGGAQYLSDSTCIRLPAKIEQDIEFLLKHLSEHKGLHHNILYPTVKDTGALPNAVTHTNRAKHDVSIKTRVFRTMMAIRESLCAALDIDLPNCAASKGKLNPTRYEEMFE
jgi:hypothetical protein